MENPDVDFIKSLSSRLTAYSLEAEREREAAAENGAETV
jgi:hypothetical protein